MEHNRVENIKVRGVSTGKKLEGWGRPNGKINLTHTSWWHNFMHFIVYPHHFAFKDFIALCTKTEKVFSIGYSL